MKNNIQTFINYDDIIINMDIKNVIQWLQEEYSKGNAAPLKQCYNLYMRVYNHKVNPSGRQVAYTEYNKKRIKKK